PGGGLSPDGSRWIACKPGIFLPVRVLSRLFRRLFLGGIAALHAAGRLAFLGDLAPLAEKRAFDAALAPLRRSEWVVYAKRPFAGPQAVRAGPGPTPTVKKGRRPKPFTFADLRDRLRTGGEHQKATVGAT